MELEKGARSAAKTKGVMATLRTNWAATKEQPLIIVMGILNFLVAGSLLLCFATLALHFFGGVSHALLGIALTGAAIGGLFWMMTTAVGARLFSDQIKAHHDIDELLGLTEALQSAESYEDTATVLTSTSLELLPDFGGALYVFNNSRDRLDLVGKWAVAEDFVFPEMLSPSNCWTLKRGRVHINRPNSVKLRCPHHVGDSATLEVPMIARGAIYGLLIFVADDQQQGAEACVKAARIAQAMAEAMSLALSNIALREKLRTQSLRDPLTGLYNRRYMEDALERFVSLGERSRASTSVLMLDLDNFKALNDEFGHAKGDAVLRDVAAQIVGGVRPSDVVCRYGGEEIVAILPECSLKDAKLKAEKVRLRIHGLSEVHGVPISASIGLATIPETSTSVADVLAMADSALYAAKTGGKNRVVCAKQRGAAEEAQPRLAVAGG